MEQHLAIHAVLVPSLVAMAICVASRFLPLIRRVTPMLVPLAIASVAVRAGVVQESASILSTWPPSARWITAILCITVTAVGGAVLGAFPVRDDDRGFTGTALVAGLLASGVVLGLLEVPGESTRWIVARTAIAAGVLSIVLSTGKVRGPGICLSLAFPMAALAGMLLVSGSAKLAVTAGSIAFTCGLLGLLAIPFRLTLGAGGVATMTVGATALAAQGRSYDYNSFPSWLWLIAVLAPLTGCAADAPLARLLPGPVRFVLRVVPPLVVSAAALLFAAWRAGAFSSGESGDPYGS